MVGRAAALLALAVALGAYYVGADSLPISGLWTQVVLLWFLVIPAVFGLVYLALPLWQKMNRISGQRESVPLSRS